MNKVLYVNGCSHSCGAEISFKNSLRQPKDLELSWAGQLAKKYNRKHVNSAYSGQCNNAILSATMYDLPNLLNRHTSDEIFVIIGWTSFDRTYYIYEDKKFIFVPGIHETDAYKNEWPRSVKIAFEHWVSGSNHNDNLNKFSLIYENMTNLLKINNIKYYYFNAINELEVPKKDYLNILNNFQTNYHLFEKIKNDSSYLDPFNIDMTYYHYLKKRYDGNIGGRNHHFLSDAQEEWADILEEQIGNIL